MRFGYWVRLWWVVSLTLVVAGAARAVSPTTRGTPQDDELRVELDTWRTFRRALKTSEEPEAAVVAHWAAAVRCLHERSVEILGENECAALKDRLYRDEVRKLFLQKVVGPRVAPTDGEVEIAVRQSVKASVKPEGIRVLEIFLWAPKDLPDLRSLKRLKLEELGAQLGTTDGFRDAAQRYSEATSAYKQGQIGTVYKDQIPEALWTALEETEDGLTPILETSTGFFRFFILGRRPARQPDASTLAPRIRRRMIANGIRTRQASILNDLRRELAVEIIRLSPGGAADRASDVLVMELSLEKVGAEVEVPHEREVVTLGEMALERFVETEMSSPERMREVSDRARRLVATVSKRQLWSFEIVRVAGVDRSERLFELFRIRHDVGETAELADVVAQIHDVTGLDVSIETYNKVDNRKVASLGPEIHQSLQIRCSTGAISRPLHLPDRKEAVFIRLKSIDEVGSDNTKGALAAARQRVRSEVLKQLVAIYAKRCSDSDG